MAYVIEARFDILGGENNAGKHLDQFNRRARDGRCFQRPYLGCREFPAEFDLPAYLGYSIGHWEGDTFVVETRGFNGKTVLDAMGHPLSDAADIIERFHRRDFGRLDYEITFDDPKFYTRKVTVRIPHELVTNNDIFEMFCENEKDAVHMPKR